MRHPPIGRYAACIAFCFAMLAAQPLVAGISGLGLYPTLPEPPPMSWTPFTGYLRIAESGLGSLAITNGSSVSTSSIFIASTFDAYGSLTVEGENSTLSSAVGLNMIIGNLGTADLLIRDQGNVVGSATFGEGEGSTGTGLVEGQYSRLTGSVTVGGAGTGSLTIRDQAVVTSGSANYIGRDGTGQGEVIVSGEGSRWTAAGMYASSGTIWVGFSGKGTLRIENGATVASGTGTLGSTSTPTYIGGQPASLKGEGHVTITGDGSAWEIGTELIVGQGTGADNWISVENGGFLQDNIATLGWDSFHRGRVTVTGAGSSWVNIGALVIGRGGLGTVTLANGASLSNTSATLGSGNAGNLSEHAIGNTVLATGTGTTWTNSGALQIGVYTHGTVEIADGARVVATQVGLDSSTSQYLSQITLRGDSNARGVLETARVAEGSGYGGGRIQFDGGILRATQHEANFLQNFEADEITVTNNGGYLDTNGFNVGINATITGPGGLTKLGAGTLSLGGTVAVDGPLTIQGGRFDNSGLVGGASFMKTGTTLAGSGQFDGLVTLESGATLAPGNSPGTLTFADGLTFETGTVLDFELGTASDLLRVSGGTLTGPAGTGGITLNFSDSGGFTSRTYTLINYANASLSDFDLSDIAYGTTIAGYNYQLNFVGSTLQLTATAVPEPATYALAMAVAGLGFVAWRRRKSSRKGA